MTVCMNCAVQVGCAWNGMECTASLCVDVSWFESSQVCVWMSRGLNPPSRFLTLCTLPEDLCGFSLFVTKVQIHHSLCGRCSVQIEYTSSLCWLGIVMNMWVTLKSVTHWMEGAINNELAFFVGRDHMLKCISHWILILTDKEVSSCVF